MAKTGLACPGYGLAPGVDLDNAILRRLAAASGIVGHVHVMTAGMIDGHLLAAGVAGKGGAGVGRAGSASCRGSASSPQRSMTVGPPPLASTRGTPMPEAIRRLSPVLHGRARRPPTRQGQALAWALSIMTALADRGPGGGPGYGPGS